MFRSILFVSALVATANAHGIVQWIQTGGQKYTSPTIGASGETGPFWLVSDNSPITDPTSSESLCGRVATKPSSSIEAAAGETLSYYWSSGYSPTDTIWPHNTGPMFFYMAKCDGDCNSISGSTKFFKLQQDGYESSGVWQQADLHAGKTVSFTIPSELEAGDYVIRHEVINLASTAEQFPSCANFKITGSGTKSLSGTSTTFPGAYQLSDPGLSVAGTAVYSITSNSGYTFPGPPVSSLGSGSDSDSGSGSGSSEPADSSTQATETAASSSALPTPPIVANPGGDPASATVSDDSEPTAVVGAASSATDSTDTETDTETDTATATATDAESAPAPASTSTGTDAGSLGSCATQWTACNAKYTGSAADAASYHCQTDYVTCVQASMSNGTAAKRMHRRHRALFSSHSH